MPTQNDMALAQRAGRRLVAVLLGVDDFKPTRPCTAPRPAARTGWSCSRPEPVERRPRPAAERRLAPGRAAGIMQRAT
jgi:hypothetical protein